MVLVSTGTLSAADNVVKAQSTGGGVLGPTGFFGDFAEITCTAPTITTTDRGLIAFSAFRGQSVDNFWRITHPFPFFKWVGSITGGTVSATSYELTGVCRCGI